MRREGEGEGGDRVERGERGKREVLTLVLGHFMQGLSMPVGPRTREGVDGYQVVSPFKLENG